MHQEYTVVEGDFVNAGTASSSVKKTLKQLGVSPQIIKRVVVALYEAEVNAIAHAYGGKVLVDIEADKIHMVVADKGPGIPDIAQAMQEGYSTARPEVRDMGFGAGMGLPNMQKAVWVLLLLPSARMPILPGFNRARSVMSHCVKVSCNWPSM